MQFTLVTLAVLLASVSASPVDLISRDGNGGANAVIKCPADVFTSGDQTYATACESRMNLIGSTVIQNIPTVKNLVDCLAHCTASSDAGTCCVAVEFKRAAKKCTLYSTSGGVHLAPVGYVTALATTLATTCGI